MGFPQQLHRFGIVPPPSINPGIASDHTGSRLKILILKPSSLGDVVQALPVLRLLRLHFDSAEIYWWVATPLAGLIEEDRDLTGIFRFDRKRWASPLRWHEALQSLSAMRSHRFDWVIDLQGLLRSGVVSWLSGGEFCVGVEDPREGAPAFYDLAVGRPSPSAHAVDWYLEVVRRIGVPTNRAFEWIPSRMGVQKTIREKWPVSGFRWVGLQPGARWMNKRWPIPHFVVLATRLLREFEDLRIVVFGGEDDRSLGQAIRQACGEKCLDLTGKTSLSETVEWLRLCSVLVTNDTGPMHMAAAVGTSVVGLFGPTDPHRTGPYGQIEKVMRIPIECAPCMKSTCAHEEPMACLARLSPDVAFGEVLARIGSFKA